jgi:hypothetical protein
MQSGWWALIVAVLHPLRMRLTSSPNPDGMPNFARYEAEKTVVGGLIAEPTAWRLTPNDRIKAKILRRNR